MPEDRFADRLDPATYADDDEVVGIFESNPSEADALWLSARLFRRLTGVARAYELHALPLLDDPDPVRVNRARCETVLDEIAFVAERLDDPVAVGVAPSITDYLIVRTRRPAWDGTRRDAQLSVVRALEEGAVPSRHDRDQPRPSRRVERERCTLNARARHQSRPQILSTT